MEYDVQDTEVVAHVLGLIAHARTLWLCSRRPMHMMTTKVTICSGHCVGTMDMPPHHHHHHHHHTYLLYYLAAVRTLGVSTIDDNDEEGGTFRHGSVETVARTTSIAYYTSRNYTYHYLARLVI